MNISCKNRVHLLFCTIECYGEYEESYEPEIHRTHNHTEHIVSNILRPIARFNACQ